MIIDQFPGAQLGQEPQVLQKLRTGDIDFAITSAANSATVQPESGVFSIHFVFRSEDHLKKALADPAVVAAFREMMNSKVEGATPWRSARWASATSTASARSIAWTI